MVLVSKLDLSGQERRRGAADRGDPGSVGPARPTFVPGTNHGSPRSTGCDSLPPLRWFLHSPRSPTGLD